jgi:hypothetical protein
MIASRHSHALSKRSNILLWIKVFADLAHGIGEIRVAARLSKSMIY